MASIAIAPLKNRPAIKQLILLVTVKGKGHTMITVAQNFLQPFGKDQMALRLNEIQYKMFLYYTVRDKAIFFQIYLTFYCRKPKHNCDVQMMHCLYIKQVL